MQRGAAAALHTLQARETGPVAAPPLHERNEFYAQLFHQFKRQVGTTLEGFRHATGSAIAKCEARLQRCESRLVEYVNFTQTQRREDFALADALVKKEMRTKVLTTQWTNRFLETAEEQIHLAPEQSDLPSRKNKPPIAANAGTDAGDPNTETGGDLDPITYAISRHAMNIALCYQDVTPEYILSTQTPRHLIDFLSLRTNLVTGPSLLAIMHISLYPSLRQPIVAAGILPVILRIIVENPSPIILALCAKICASLALEPANKTSMAQSGCIHAIVDLLSGRVLPSATFAAAGLPAPQNSPPPAPLGSRLRNGDERMPADPQIQFYALCALVNCLQRNDANRVLATELRSYNPLLEVLETSTEERILTQTARCFANIAFGNAVTSNNLLVNGTAEGLMRCIDCVDIIRQPLLVHSCLSALANMCMTDLTQTHVGNISGLIEAVIRIIQYGRAIYLVTEAANFIVATTWRNQINKSRVAGKNGISVLVSRILLHGRSTDQRDLVCAERLCLALASVLMYSSNHERFTNNGDMERITNLCKAATHPTLLRALAKILVVMIPSPDEFLLYRRDHTQHIVEKLDVITILKKVRLKAFTDFGSAPLWLEGSIEYLLLSDQQLENAPVFQWSRQEFVDQPFYCKEFTAEVLPDASPNDDHSFRGLLFTIF